MSDSVPLHTLGPTCVFHNDETTDAPTDSPDPPPIRAQFFYVSSVPIDDPLSPLPPVSSDIKSSASHQPQPFSARDNAALTEAWQGIEHLLTKSYVQGAGHLSRPQLVERGRTLGELVRFPRFKGDGKSPTATSSLNDNKPTSASTELGDHTPAKPNEQTTGTNTILSSGQKLKMPSAREDEGLIDETSDRASQKKRRRFSPFRKIRDPEGGYASSVVSTDVDQTDRDAHADISGRPFARAPSQKTMDGQDDQISDATAEEPDSHQREASGGLPSSPTHPKLHNILHPHKKEDKGEDAEGRKVVIPVGVSRLHLVEMPDLLMKPIYWNPVNDVSAVLRATWFYVTTMLPVEPELANWLESGYEEFKPWTDTWQDELNSCIEIGAEAEMKVVYHLFPDKGSSRPGSGAAGRQGQAQARDEQDRLLAQGPSVGHESLAAGPQSDKFHTWPPNSSQRFKNHGVIYVDARHAQILRPSLAPSVSRNRKPIAAIRKGREIGVAVIRGFSQRAWEKLHPPSKMNARAAHAKVGAYLSQSANTAIQDQHISCPPCRNQEQKHTPHVTDLVLIIHGIGQKLSERVDSFNFTHAISAFRREVNVELSSEVVQGNIRREQGGIMVLPVNWRLTMSFDDGAEAKGGNEENKFQLEDITPNTLPAVRSLISDVMLDIPYYLSHHKQKMISAVVREANKVYRLWCRNNPGFHESGRVHLIAHSLGSAMAMDILSQQPTRLPQHIDVLSNKHDETNFEFDTKSLFCCGSPAGFFLLLNKANLVPRAGRQKPGTDSEDEQGIAGEAGRYGCLAVDNVYNVMALYDPISYNLNAAVDSEYAASLKPAMIPPLRQGVLASIGLSWGQSASTRPFGLVSSTASATAQRPAITKMPSTIEMDTHNFTREEVAERRMFLLNDNGQIDFTLSSDGGPLDFQYWNMLSAHSSYWLRRDFVRFLVIEIGREQGRQGTLSALTAQKKRIFKAGKIA